MSIKFPAKLRVTCDKCGRGAMMPVTTDRTGDTEEGFFFGVYRDTLENRGWAVAMVGKGKKERVGQLCPKCAPGDGG